MPPPAPQPSRPLCPLCRLEKERGGEGAAAALLAAVAFAIDAQQEAGAPAALRAMLGPAASVAAAVVQHASSQKPPPRLSLSGLMSALASLLLDCAKLDLAAFTADLATAEAALRCAVAAGNVAAARGSAPQRSTLWGELLPAAFKAVRKMGALPTLLGWAGLGGDACLPAAAMWRGGAAANVSRCMLSKYLQSHATNRHKSLPMLPPLRLARWPACP